MTAVTHAISGSLYDELGGTSLGENWGYGGSVETDREVLAMYRAATSRKVGYGAQFTMTGSRDAWLAIAEYAADRGYMEQNLAGDFDSGLGKRLEEQAAKIRALLGESA